MSRIIPECDNGEEDDLRHEDRMAGQVSQKLNEHPDCRDPDHPGCMECEEGIDPHELDRELADECEECNGCGEPVDDCICDEEDEAYNMLMQES